MVLTASTMMPLGTEAPAFSLPNVVDGRVVSREDFRGRQGLLVMFICNHCPYVKHIRGELARVGRDYQPALGIVAISANDVANYPDDSPEKMAEEALEQGYSFPYLYDASQDVAKAYTAACTPDFFLFDARMRLVYRGQLDASRPGNEQPVTGADLRGAIEALLGDAPISPDQKPSMGCNIKWTPGNAPS
jgi:peroxiredoxin